jgi:hypothetical protein
VPLLVTSAAGVNGDGFGALLAFDRNGRPLGAFSNDARIADPRGLAVDQRKELLFLNSGSDRVLALDRNGKVVRDTGPIPQLDPGGGTFAPDGRYCVGLRSARTIMVLAATLEDPGERILPPGVVPTLSRPMAIAPPPLFAIATMSLTSSHQSPVDSGSNALLKSIVLDSRFALSALSTRIDMVGNHPELQRIISN